LGDHPLWCSRKRYEVGDHSATAGPQSARRYEMDAPAFVYFSRIAMAVARGGRGTLGGGGWRWLDTTQSVNSNDPE